MTSKQNTENRAGAKTGNRSGVRGVSWHARTRKWLVQVGHAGRTHHVGLFVDRAEAERVAIAKRNELFTNKLADQRALDSLAIEPGCRR